MAGAGSLTDRLRGSCRVLRSSRSLRQIKGLSGGDITVSDLACGEGEVQGVDSRRIQQVIDAKIVEMGSYPLRNIHPAAK